MDEQERAKTGRRRVWKFYSAIACAAMGVLALGAGFAFAQGREGDAATGAGVLAGMGFSFLVVGLAFAWKTRPGDTRWMTETPRARQERLQAQRTSQLFLFPLVALIFLVLSFGSVGKVVGGEGAIRDYLQILLPVLYGWLTAAIAMGWDGNSRQNRRFLEDELTIVIRARAMTAAFLVMMGGATVALGLLLARPEYGAMALLTALAGAGATAGVRFAWLDREAGQDG